MKHPNTFYSFIQQNLVCKKATTKTRREIIQDLLSNDPRSKSQQVWTLEKKKKKIKEDKNQDARLVEKYKMKMKLPSPLNDFLTLWTEFRSRNDVSFFPKQQCINKIPHWTNLKPPDRIRADSSFTDIKDTSLPICNSVDWWLNLEIDVFEFFGHFFLQTKIFCRNEINEHLQNSSNYNLKFVII